MLVKIYSRKSFEVFTLILVLNNTVMARAWWETAEPTSNSTVEHSTPSTQYRSENNTITFSNQSGEPALVKVRGATSTQTFVPNGSSSTVNASGGTHYIVVRYGSSPPYTYSKGESFSVDETANQYSAISITLHKVAHGNYSSSSTNQAEFDSR